MVFLSSLEIPPGGGLQPWQLHDAGFRFHHQHNPRLKMPAKVQFKDKTIKESREWSKYTTASAGL
jgi:hypothetical protein